MLLGSAGLITGCGDSDGSSLAVDESGDQSSQSTSSSSSTSTSLLPGESTGEQTLSPISSSSSSSSQADGIGDYQIIEDPITTPKELDGFIVDAATVASSESGTLAYENLTFDANANGSVDAADMTISLIAASEGSAYYNGFTTLQVLGVSLSEINTQLDINLTRTDISVSSMDDKTYNAHLAALLLINDIIAGAGEEENKNRSFQRSLLGTLQNYFGTLGSLSGAIENSPSKESIDAIQNSPQKVDPATADLPCEIAYAAISPAEAFKDEQISFLLKTNINACLNTKTLTASATIDNLYEVSLTPNENYELIGSKEGFSTGGERFVLFALKNQEGHIESSKRVSFKVNANSYYLNTDQVKQKLEGKLWTPIIGSYEFTRGCNNWGTVFGKWEYGIWGANNGDGENCSATTHLDNNNGTGQNSFGKASDRYAIDINLRYKNDKDAVVNGDADNKMPVYASHDGVVVGHKGVWGSTETKMTTPRAQDGYVVIKHTLSDGGVFYTGYMHMDNIESTITSGAAVQQGQKLGTLSNKTSSGSSLTPHLHYAIYAWQYNETAEINHLHSVDPTGLFTNVSRYTWSEEYEEEMEVDTDQTIRVTASYGSDSFDLNTQKTPKTHFWSSTDESICTVDGQSGKVKLLKANTCKTTLQFSGETRTYEINGAPEQDAKPTAAFTIQSSTSQSTTAFSTTDTIFLTSTSTDDQGIASQTWKIDGTPYSTSSSASISAKDLGVGTHTITLTVTDTSGQSVTKESTITITEQNNPTSLTLSASSTSITAGQSVTFSVSASDDDGLSKLEIAYGYGGHGNTHTANGSTTATTTFSHTYTQSGSYTVTLTATDSQGNTQTKSTIITVQEEPEEPIVDGNWITPSQSVCESNGGTYSIPYCYATWSEAKTICSASGGRLPTIAELGAVVTGCGGTFASDDLYESNYNQWDEIANANYANTSYQSCFRAAGFTIDNGYWSSESRDSSTAWYVSLHYGYQHWRNQSSHSDYVRCVR